jgi:ribosome-associated protein
MKQLEFTLTDEYIDLIKLLKACSIAESGSHAKELVNSGLVKVNGEIEDRMRRKIYKDFKVEIDNYLINVV